MISLHLVHHLRKLYLLEAGFKLGLVAASMCSVAESLAKKAVNWASNSFMLAV